jgi:hypothetical protein
MNTPQHAAQRGNVLFYILIAIALLAALTYAVAQSSRGNVSQLSAEKGRLLATEIIEYSNIMASAVAQLKLRGVKESELCFDDAGWGNNDYDHAGCADSLHKIFHPQGGGLTWTRAPHEAMSTALVADDRWHIYSDNEVQDVGTTCADDNCSELILVVDELSQVVCEEIDILLNIIAKGEAVPSDNSDIGETTFKGTYGYTNTINNVDLNGRTTGCFEKTNPPAEYTFYKVLIAR